MWLKKEADQKELPLLESMEELFCVRIKMSHRTFKEELLLYYYF